MSRMQQIPYSHSKYTSRKRTVHYTNFSCHLKFELPDDGGCPHAVFNQLLLVYHMLVHIEQIAVFVQQQIANGRRSIGSRQSVKSCLRGATASEATGSADAELRFPKSTQCVQSVLAVLSKAGAVYLRCTLDEAASRWKW